ncbi:DUF6884 domain-containing protein [Haladaptatus sp. CMSO5]|uniref:DUF6884 domain-containing protein n=1 Tax=Haladaptatus sp. CMSO5 TaxID=3120514 RepID=UPI002FCDFAE2
MEIGQISCTKLKRDELATPRNLYDTSALFRKASAYAEKNHDQWFDLSLKHGLSDPDGPAIDPYH